MAEFNEKLFIESMAYDLRQRYAKIVGDHLEHIAYERKLRNYDNYFRALMDLWTITKHKFKTKEKKKDKKPSKTFEELKYEVIKIGNKYPLAWSGKGNVSNEIAEIENLLREMEIWLYTNMDEAKMFGEKRDLTGLV